MKGAYSNKPLAIGIIALVLSTQPVFAQRARQKPTVSRLISSQADPRVYAYIMGLGGRFLANVIAKGLDQQTLPSRLVKGDVPSSQATKRIKRFVKKQLKLFLASAFSDTRGLDITQNDIEKSFNAGYRFPVLIQTLAATQQSLQKEKSVRVTDALSEMKNEFAQAASTFVAMMSALSDKSDASHSLINKGTATRRYCAIVRLRNPLSAYASMILCPEVFTKQMGRRLKMRDITMVQPILAFLSLQIGKMIMPVLLTKVVRPLNQGIRRIPHLDDITESMIGERVRSSNDMYQYLMGQIPALSTPRPSARASRLPLPQGVNGGGSTGLTRVSPQLLNHVSVVI